MTPEEVNAAMKRLFEGQDLLTGKVADLTEDVARLGVLMDATREEAAVDRALQREAVLEVRSAVGVMLTIAESMAANVTLLTQAQQGTSYRVTVLESRVDALEGEASTSDSTPES